MVVAGQSISTGPPRPFFQKLTSKDIGGLSRYNISMMAPAAAELE